MPVNGTMAKLLYDRMKHGFKSNSKVMLKGLPFCLANRYFGGTGSARFAS